MTKLNRLKNFIAVFSLIVNLAVFNFSVPFAMAQGEEASGQNQETNAINSEAPSEESDANAVQEQEAEGGEETGGGANNENINAANDVEIATGDVNIEVESENKANANEVNFGENGSQTEGATTHDPASEAAPSEETAAPDGANDQIADNNEGKIENNIAAEGESGNNAIGGSQGDISIATGNVNVVVGLVNTANANITDSNFLQFLFNLFKNSENDIDLSGKIGTGAREDCSASGECLNALNIVNNNQGTIENNLVINAASGNNKADSENGNAIIRTGDANIAAGIFNLLNVNIAGSNWYNLIVNIFDEWTGDLVLPGKAKMRSFANSADNSGICAANCGISASNTAEGRIENGIYIASDTGGNEAIGNAASIHTGNADSKTNLLNIANADLIGSNWFFMAINNFGGWEGQIYSLPPGFSAIGDSGDIKIYNITPDDLVGKSSAETGVGVQDKDLEDNKTLVVENNNYGVIKNSVVINVSTGGNSALGAGGATIETGNASALLNIINVLNSNITGGNWMLGMVNIFGKWKGNLAFGRPDLWIGMSAAGSPNLARPGETITYTLTYANTGDADATGVTIKSGFNERYFSVASSDGGETADASGEIQWNIGAIPAGGTGSVSYSLAVRPEIPFGATSFAGRAAIASFEKDWNNDDNTDEIPTIVYKDLPVSSGAWTPPLPNLLITKTRGAEDLIYTGSKLDYKIILVNESDGSAYDVSVNDALFDESGKAVSASGWNFGEVFPREKIIIEYAVNIGSEIPAGLYTGVTQATGFNAYGNQADSPKVFSLIEIREKEINEEEETVAPAEKAAPEISSVTEETKGEIKETADKTKKAAEEKKKVSFESREKTIAASIQEILGSEASAKEETDFLELDNKDDITLSDGFLTDIKYGNILVVSGFLIFAFIGLFAFSKRIRGKEI